MEAADNILDALAGRTPRGAINAIRSAAGVRELR
jgi:hypothetical protein